MQATIKKLQSGGTARIACLGDSITEQNFHTHGFLNYAGRLTEWLLYAFERRTMVFNFGASGGTSWDAMRRLEEIVGLVKPDLATLMVGINDSQRGSEGISGFKANIVGIRDRLARDGAELLLFTQNPIHIGADRPEVVARRAYPLYVTALREVAAEAGIPLCDINAAWERMAARAPYQHWHMLNDTLHPNERGHDYMAKVAIDWLSEQAGIEEVVNAGNGLVFSRRGFSREGP